MTQDGLDFVAFGALAIQLRRQILHHLLQDLGIVREMFDVDRHVSKFSISLLTYSRSDKQKRINLEMFYAGLAGR